MEPLVFGSAGNLVIAVYNRRGKRAILDGGFTRLFYGTETAEYGALHTECCGNDVRGRGNT